MPAPLAGINLQHGLASHRAELVKTLEPGDGRIGLRAVTLDMRSSRSPAVAVAMASLTEA